jgi:putative methyltransferase (TIGR04325 family)
MKRMLNRALALARDIYTYRRFNVQDKIPRYRGVYPSLAAAECAIPKGRLQGFNLESVPDYFLQMELAFNQNDYPILFWLSQALGPDARVFDLGGGVGQCYFKYQRYLSYPQGLQWLVCDVEAFTSRGPEFAREQNVTNLTFTTDRGAADGASIYLTNGALQYIEPDLPEILAQLSALPRHVLVNRVPMYDGEPYYTVQSSIHSYVAHKVGNISQLARAMASLGYERIDQWQLPRTLRVPFHPERYVSNYRGFYFRLPAESVQSA